MILAIVPFKPPSMTASVLSFISFLQGGGGWLGGAMYKACSRCGKIHRVGHECPKAKRDYSGGAERKLRSTNRWTQKSREIREKASYLCEVCKDQGVINYDGVEVHHIVKLKDDESLLLDNNNLICLCGAHHEQADHDQIDSNYLRHLADKRERYTQGGGTGLSQNLSRGMECRT